MAVKLLIYTDGGARGNPGPAAIGVMIKKPDGKTVSAYGEYIGRQTNNYAEYFAIISGLKKAKELGADEVDCFLDSLLVVEQLNRRWKIKEPTLQKLFVQTYNAASAFKKIRYTHVYRENNQEADKLVNETLDKKITTPYPALPIIF